MSFETRLLQALGEYVPGAGSDCALSTSDVSRRDLTAILVPNLLCRTLLTIVRFGMLLSMS